MYLEIYSEGYEAKVPKPPNRDAKGIEEVEDGEWGIPLRS